MSAKLTVAMIVWNEERLLPDAIRSIQGIADEIIVGCDSRTTDTTERIARGAGARVHRFDWTEDFSVARNIGLSKAHKDWILVIDADERLTPWGVNMITAVMRLPDSRVAGYCLETSSRTLEDQEGRREISTVRLWPNNSKVRYAGRVYESPTYHGKLLSGGILRGGVGLIHYGGDPTLYANRHKIERNRALLTAPA